jgi:hypothetical protein
VAVGLSVVSNIRGVGSAVYMCLEVIETDKTWLPAKKSRKTAKNLAEVKY